MLSSRKSEPAATGRNCARNVGGKLVVLRPDLQPVFQHLGRNFGLHQVLMLGRSLAHGLGGGRASGSRHQRGIQTRTADQRLRRAVGRLEQPELALQTRQRQHPVLPQRGGEVLGGEAIDLVAAIGDEVEDEAQLAQLFGEAASSARRVMPVVSQLNDGDRLYASILSGNSA